MLMAAPPAHDGSVVWFRRIMWTGIIANCAMSLPCLIDPAWSIAFMRLPPATPLVWPRFSAQLVILLSALYVPAALDPLRYRLTAWTAVGCRLAGVLLFFSLFFFSTERQYWLFGAFDLAFLIPQALLLRRAVAAQPAAPLWR
jgi:hypothetical protein